MTTVFVYEYVTALGAREDQPLAPSLLAEGRAMRDAVVADFSTIPDVKVTTLDVEDEASFRKNAAAAKWALIVAPETDGILEERCRWAVDAGARLLGPSVEAIRLTADKLALAEHLKRQQVPHPRTWPLGREPADMFPIVWKPRDGAGSQETQVLHSPRLAEGDLRLSHLLQADRFIAQEYVEGMAASVAFLIGPEATVPLLPCRQHISNDGCLRYLGGSLPLPDDLSARAIKLAKRAIDVVPGLLGYAGVDIVLADEPANDCVIEINPRLTTSYVGLRQAAQFNISDALLKLVRGETLPNLTWRTDRIEWLLNGSFRPG